VLYRLWPIGVVARHLEIITRRCGTLLTWLWPCERNGTRFPDVLDIHGGGHVMEMEYGSMGKVRIFCMVVAMQYKENVVLLLHYLY